MPHGSEEKSLNDTALFEKAFYQHEADLFRYALYLADSKSDAEDIYQETWLRVANYMRRGKNIQNFKNFIFTIATNVYRDELNKRKVRRFFLGPSINDETDEHIWVSSELTPDENGLTDALRQSLRQLSTRQRTMFCLSYIEGFQVTEIGKMMNCAVGTVKATIFKAVQKLRHELKEFRD